MDIIMDNRTLTPEEAFDLGREVGRLDRQPEVDELRARAATYYRAAYGDELWLPRFRYAGLTRAELEERRRPKVVPPITVEDAKRSWSRLSTAAPHRTIKYDPKQYALGSA
ncbi:hypothetical protein [Clavibacter tessellarius]|uniref:hypothetical protein n=1 Tax=Clavibacter tessellarius TaxID=31965 RepID=UPI0032539BAD